MCRFRLDVCESTYIAQASKIPLPFFRKTSSRNQVSRSFSDDLGLGSGISGGLGLTNSGFHLQHGPDHAFQDPFRVLCVEAP